MSDLRSKQRLEIQRLQKEKDKLHQEKTQAARAAQRQQDELQRIRRQQRMKPAGAAIGRRPLRAVDSDLTPISTRFATSRLIWIIYQ